jgi:hypothetical protein
MTFEELSNKLMKIAGPSGNLEGEVIRAYSKVAYRYYNDGDFATHGYGAETAGPALTFLIEEAPSSIVAKAREIEVASDVHSDFQYKNALKELEDEIAKWVNAQIEAVGGIENLEEDYSDMLETESMWKDNEHSGSYWEDEEELAY